MEYSVSPTKIRNEAGRLFMVVSEVEGGFLVRDAVTSDLVYIKQGEVASKGDEQTLF
jgi:hypothetical protein